MAIIQKAYPFKFGTEKVNEVTRDWENLWFNNRDWLSRGHPLGRGTSLYWPYRYEVYQRVWFFVQPFRSN